MSTTRQQVFALIIDTMQAAMRDGRDPRKVAAAAFPGTPDMILGEAYAEASCAEVENWWQRVERIIDGEVIHNAVSKAAAS